MQTQLCNNKIFFLSYIYSCSDILFKVHHGMKTDSHYTMYICLSTILYSPVRVLSKIIRVIFQFYIANSTQKALGTQAPLAERKQCLAVVISVNKK